MLSYRKIRKEANKIISKNYFKFLSICFMSPLFAVRMRKCILDSLQSKQKYSINSNRENINKEYKTFNVVFVTFVMQLRILFWSLLLIVPGIIKSYEYSMIYYILAEEPGIDYKKAFALSKKMTKDNKKEIFKIGFLAGLNYNLLPIICICVSLIFGFKFDIWYSWAIVLSVLLMILMKPFELAVEVATYFKLKENTNH